MSANSVLWLAFIVCTGLYIYGLTLPPDKPNKRPGRGCK
jgi:hypothetical protein